MYDDVEKTGGWIFVIDTDQYAGNFERELTAYITGMSGDCGVGDEMFPYYVSETGDKNREKFEDLLEFRSDEHGCHRPCAIYSTPGWFNHGMGGHFRVGQEEEALKDYVKQIKQVFGKEYMANPLRAKAALERGEKYSNWTLKAVEEEIARHNKEIEWAEKMKKVNKCPAYMSVAIFFYEKPPTELIEFMKQRAEGFVKAKQDLAKKKDHPWDKNFKLNIAGFRLIKENLSVEEQAV